MKIRLRISAALLAAVLGAGFLAGCGNTRIVLTTGLASDELFRIGEESCRLSEALIYLTNQKNQYEDVYGIEMWGHDFGGTTLEEYLKSQVVSQLAQVKSMVLLAKERGIALTAEEQEKAKEAAAEYFSSLDEKEISLLEISQEEIAGMYQDYCLAYKAYNQITEDVSVEISDDEARIILIQQIFVPEKTLAEDLKRRLDAGEDFESLSANYSKASQTTISIARGDKSKEYEEIAFNLDNEGVSEVFAADGGYYLLKCLNTYLEEESERNKEKVAKQQKTKRFQKIYSDLMKNTLSEFQQKLWDKVIFADYNEAESSSFFRIYEKHFDG